MWMVPYLNKVPGYALSQLQMLCSRKLSTSEIFQSCLQKRGKPLMNSLHHKSYHGALVRNQNCATSYKLNDNLCVSPLWFVPRRYYTEEEKSKWWLILSELKHIKHSSKPALAFGVLSLAPFYGMPFSMIDTHAYLPELAIYQVYYGALLLACLAGVRIGVSIIEGSGGPPKSWHRTGYILATLFFAQGGGLDSSSCAGLVFIIPCLAWAAYYDVTHPGYPPWFKSLRLVHTALVIFSYFLTFMCFMKLKEGKPSAKNRYLKV